jgi:hypothetical protein
MTQTGLLDPAIKDHLSGRPPEWLVRTWVFAGKKQTYEAYSWDWDDEYPDLAERVQEAVKQGLIDGESKPLPTPDAPEATPDTHWIKLKPRTLELLKAAIREKPGAKTHGRQLTQTLEDGTKLVIDTRNLVNAVLATPERAARACIYWVDVFRDPESPAMKTRVRLNLERADALWGGRLEEENPGLYLRIMQALGHPEKSALNPILALDDMEEGP